MKYEKEINSLLRELLFENWMDEEDWKNLLDELEKQSGISIESLAKDLELGAKNGCPIETQVDLFRVVIKNLF